MFQIFSHLNYKWMRDKWKEKAESISGETFADSSIKGTKAHWIVWQVQKWRESYSVAFTVRRSCYWKQHSTKSPKYQRSAVEEMTSVFHALHQYKSGALNVVFSFHLSLIYIEKNRINLEPNTLFESCPTNKQEKKENLLYLSLI